jgi:hypothetical protein
MCRKVWRKCGQGVGKVGNGGGEMVRFMWVLAVGGEKKRVDVGLWG